MKLWVGAPSVGNTGGLPKPPSSRKTILGSVRTLWCRRADRERETIHVIQMNEFRRSLFAHGLSCPA